ncbi:alpha/beta hydrolase [Amnibacterium kyonggiense]|uniref:Putative esterase n=1 Tax=Amnibacterium kyonggiense TaxID=595671 RepID=A0A4R7FMB4_9MICO|nr:alpha/beta hydrolase-fold protein [Amnibacterium kyonggiense]TDS77610.1 putative esterase [Amnibacterium kyonggiense]
MPSWLRDLPIERDHVLVPVYVVAAVLLAVLLLPRPGTGWRLRTRIGVLALAAGVGALLGWVAVYEVVVVQDLFGAPASAVIFAAALAAGAGIGLAVVNLVRTRWWRKVVAIVALPAVIAASGLMINRDVAYYPRLGDVVGDTGVTTLPIDVVGGKGHSLKNWVPPADMPTTGTLGTRTIPGTESHFKAREAWIYLPPAALVKHPPKLPVIVAFSGEPGGPSDVFLAGNLQAPLDALAAKHKGIAPIVVVPDQLGGYAKNPMCVNSKLGNVATYVTDDVRDWILQNLPVSTNRLAWTVAGFSEGATCAVQFATEHPTLFGSAIAVSSELGPRNGSVAHTIAVGFHGSRKAYAAAQPIAIMKRVGHYPATAIAFSVGADDLRYGADTPLLVAAAKKVGITTHFETLAGLAHNWNTGAAGLSYGLDVLTPWWKLP